MKRAMNRCHQVLVNACHRHAKLETMQVTKIVPRLPSTRFSGCVNLSIDRQSAILRLRFAHVSFDSLPASEDCAAQIWG